MRLSLWDAANPLGTLYNPLSIAASLRCALGARPDVFRESLFEAEGRFHSWLFDSGLSSENGDDSVEEFLCRSRRLLAMLEGGEALFVTFGTAWCYFLASKPDFVVANCHKQPSGMFLRRLVGVEEIVEVWSDVAEELAGRFPGLRIVFTVSPVRHLKDGFEGNSLSKAVLRLAIDGLCRRYSFCSYFPAFELLLDDLRDYRFYASDLTHPSEEAVGYIWEKFRATYLDASGEALLREGEKLRKRFAHRPLPSASRMVSEHARQEESRRLASLEDLARSFALRHPSMLPPR